MFQSLLGDFLFIHFFMNSTFPSKLMLNDGIRIIAPSLSKTIVDEITLQQSQSFFEANGYSITFGTYTEECNLFDSSPIQSRLSDIADALNDPDTKMILPAIGGYNCNQLLPFLDYETIQQTKKIWCGMSDITVLLNAIYAKTGLVTYLGPNFNRFGLEAEREYTAQSFFAAVSGETTTPLSTSSYYFDQNNREINPGPIIINSGHAKGTIIGGNLCSFNLLQGTEYMPPLKNSILFIEDDPLLEDFAVEFERNLYSVLQQKDGRSIRGICIGRFEKACSMTTEKLNAIFDTDPLFKSIPIIANLDFGHTLPMATIPIGGTAEIIATEEQAQIFLLQQ